MKFKKEFNHASIFGIFLIIFQIILYFNDYREYQTSVTLTNDGFFVLAPQSISDVIYLFVYSIPGIIGIILLFFKRKNK